MNVEELETKIKELDTQIRHIRDHHTYQLLIKPKLPIARLYDTLVNEQYLTFKLLHNEYNKKNLTV
jgi:hypothetical protein